MRYILKIKQLLIGVAFSGDIPAERAQPLIKKRCALASRFFAIPKSDTGSYFRTGILDEEGKDTGIDPFMASYPHLIDVGVMGHCIHGKTGLCAKAGIGCGDTNTWVNWSDCGRDEIEEFLKRYNGAKSEEEKEKAIDAMAAFIKSAPTFLIPDDDEEPAELPCVWTGDDDSLREYIKVFLDVGEADYPYGVCVGRYVEEYVIDMDGKNVSRKIVTYYGPEE